MTAIAVTSPYPQFFETDGDPLEAGFISIGLVDQNPLTAPKTAYWDAALTQPAAQPLRTLNGYLVRNGTPAVVYVDGEYSLLVRDKRQRQVYFFRNSVEAGGIAALGDANNAQLGDAMVGVRRLPNGAARTQHQKNADFATVADFGTIGMGDDAAVLQLALDNMVNGGDLYATDRAYDIGATMLTASYPGTRLILGNGTTITYTGDIAIKLAAPGCAVVGGKAGGFIGPSVWDGTNTAPTYGVIWIAAIKCEVVGTRFFNIKKVGVWVKDFEDATVADNLFEGNYPQASWTGVETGHWGVIFDPGLGLSGGNFKLLDNTIKGCVQGCQPGNYGVGAVVRGFEAVGNLFEGCWNHGIYSNFTNGALISANHFNQCQIPVVISGSYNAVVGNSLHTAASVVGDERDVTGISVRDGSFNVISGNTIRGVLNPPSNGVVINIQDVSGAADLIGNVVSNNTIDVPAGLGVLIRVTASTKVCSGNIINGNVLRGSAPAGEGLIGVYGPTGKVGGAVTGVTQANPGVITLTTAHGLAVNDIVKAVDFQGMTQINGTYRVNSTPTALSLSLKTIAGVPVDTTAFGAWTSGGEVRRANIKNAANKVYGNNMTALAKGYGVYLIGQEDAQVYGNTVDYAYNAAAPETNVTVAMFDSYRCASHHNTSVVRPTFGTNLSIIGTREFSGTVTQQAFNNTTSWNIDQVDTTLGAVFQGIEALNGSAMLLEHSAPSQPTVACAVGSRWFQTNGTPNSTLWVKQSGTSGTGWAPMGVGPVDAPAADIANRASSINTTEKYNGKLVWDTTGTRLMRALGAADNSGWRVVDGSATVTPV